MIHDLDDCLISERIYQSWMAYIPVAIQDLQNRLGNLSPSEIPDEQLKELPNGSAKIFVLIRGVELSMAVTSGEWTKK